MNVWRSASRDAVLPPLGGTAALADASEDELRVLLCLLERGQVSDGESDALARAAGCSPARARSALHYWTECHILACTEEDGAEKPAPAKEKKKPLRAEARLSPRTAEETAAVLQKPGRAAFVSSCEQIVGRVFNTAELNILGGLLEELPFSEEYILTLISYCKKKTKKFSFHYLEKTAFSMLERECLTTEQLNAYLASADRFASEEWKLRRMFGIGERALTPREEGYLFRWTGEYGYGQDIIGIAYDIAVDRTGKLSLPYMDKLLTAFHTAGCRDTAAVEEYLEAERAERDTARAARGNAGRKKPEKKESAPSYDLDDFIAAALQRSYGDDGVPGEKKN